MARAEQLILIIGSTALLLWTTAAGASPIFRCDGPDGVVFADTPCGSDATQVEIDDRMLGVRLDGGASSALTEDGRDGVSPANSPAVAPVAPSPCRTFQSTRLRTHLIREEVVSGMTREHVLDAWGSPSESYAEPIEMWVYDNKYYGRLVSVTRVYFEDGCVNDVDRVAP